MAAPSSARICAGASSASPLCSASACHSLGGAQVRPHWRWKTASSRWMGSSQRKPLRSMACFWPIGKLSSLRSGCSSTSTSSMMSTPRSRHSMSMTRTSASAMSLRRAIWSRRRITSRLARRLSRGCRCSGCRRSRLCSCSTNLSSRLLTHSGAAHTTLRWRRARSSLAKRRITKSALSSTLRSNCSVYTVLVTIAEKRLRSTLRLCSSSAVGITCVTSFSPSARISASSGPTTVVLPAPMIICWTRESPRRTFSTNHSTISTWRSRSTRPKMYSKSRKRGS
mmetsp:Transcript_10210/g.31422  ORF Transcript_10210/g.31422 Transcript_10210/m.31422 type:complete len:282 (-) Transcript_10210:938-1783(-)